MVVRWFVRAPGGLCSVQAAFFSFWSCATPGGLMFYSALAAPFALEAFFNLFRHLAWSCSRVRSVWALAASVFFSCTATGAPMLCSAYVAFLLLSIARRRFARCVVLEFLFAYWCAVRAARFLFSFFMWLLMILLSRLGRAFVYSEAPSVSTAPSLEAGERVPLERRWGSLPLGKAFFSCSSC